MTPPHRRTPRELSRADLPAELTPQTLRRLGLGTLRQLSDRDNGILTAEEQAQFDAAATEVFAGIRRRVQAAEGRATRGGPGGPGGLDPEMRRRYARTQERLAERARRAREAFPELDWPDQPAWTTTPTPDTPTEPSETTTAPPPADDDVSAESLDQEIEETSTTLELLDRIASIQQQQLEHQESQLLLDTRGFFFAFLVSVAVIVAGVAPLVEATPHDRLLIVAWTIAACVLAGGVYAVVRLVQRRR